MSHATALPLIIDQVDPVTGAKFFLVIHDPVSVVAAGGLRISETVDLDEVRRLAATMELKFKLFGGALGGAKAGICLPTGWTPDLRRQALHGFGRMMAPYLASRYLTGEDMGSYPADIAAVYEGAGLHSMVVAKNLMKKLGFRSFLVSVPDFIYRMAAVPRKRGWNELTAEGIFQSIAIFQRLSGLELRGRSVALQGVGKLGGELARFLEHAQARVIRVADRAGALENDAGISVRELVSIVGSDGLMNRTQAIERSLGRWIDHEQFLYGEVDILILGAGRDVIHAQNRDRLRCHQIVAAGNIVMSEEHEDYLYGKGIPVLPDFLVNAAIACSFSQIVQNRVNIFSKRAQRISALEEMAVRFEEVFAYSLKYKICLRQAAKSLLRS